MQIALVCDWLTNFGGAEQVMLALHELFPFAPIYTSVYNQDKMPSFRMAEMHTSFLQKIPGAQKYHQLFLELMPYAFESFDLSDYDVVFSNCHSCAKGVITKPETTHLCYCHTPTRYLWGDWQAYLADFPLPFWLKPLISSRLHKLRQWDFLAASRVDHFFANSRNVQERVKKYYRRESEVLYPPVRISDFKLSQNEGSYFLAVGRLIPYKRFDLVIRAFNQLKLPLWIAGEGPEYRKLKTLAKTNVKFCGRVNDTELAELYGNCRALIFPQEEDFGIVPLEAQACGRPVLAYGCGGALETVVEEKTGLFFQTQTPEAIAAVVQEFASRKWDSISIRHHAEQFDTEVFKEKVRGIIETNS